MAKNNNNYFSNMRNQRGEDWLVSVSNQDIINSTKRIVRDMIRGTIQYEKDGEAFLDSRFMENLLIGVRNELDINNMNYTGCSFFYQYYPSTPNMGGHIYALQCNLRIYGTILNKLEAVKATRDISHLIDIPGLLYNEKNYLS